MPTLADLARRLKGSRQDRLPRLLFLTDSRRTPDPVASVEGLPRDVAVIFRHYDAPDREDLARRVLERCRARRTPMLVAGDPGLALRIGADGVHLPEGMVMGAAPKRWLVTAAAHSERALWQAARLGADAALLSSVFPTASHPGAPVLGVWRFVALCRRSPLPVYALGGVSAETARRLLGSPCAGVAAIGAFVPSLQS